MPGHSKPSCCQITRIKKNKALAPGLTLVDVPTSDGLRALLVLRSEYIALFVATLHIGRLSPEAQANAAILQERASAAIARAFSQPGVETESPSAFAAPRPETLPVSPSWDRVIEGMEEVIEGFRKVKVDYAGLEQRVLLLEQANLGSRATSGGRLSAAQIVQVFLQLHVLRRQAGISIEEAEKRLAAQFGVAHIIDIEASEWPALTHAILALFQSEPI